MTTAALEQLRSQAMHLNELERAALAHDLIQSLDAPADQGVGEAWEAEISQRVAEVDSGRATLVSRAAFSQRLKDKLNQQG